MLKPELEILFNGMTKFVQQKLQPVMVNLLERAADLDKEEDKTSEYFSEEYEDIMKEVHKVKYINDQWLIMNSRTNS